MHVCCTCFGFSCAVVLHEHVGRYLSSRQILSSPQHCEAKQINACGRE